MVSSPRGSEGSELTAVNERRLGVVLGRALAHEIGHHLLDTPTHARSGLMRPHFDALEFTNLRDGTFALDGRRRLLVADPRRSKICLREQIAGKGHPGEALPC